MRLRQTLLVASVLVGVAACTSSKPLVAAKSAATTTTLGTAAVSTATVSTVTVSTATAPNDTTVPSADSSPPAVTEPASTSTLTWGPCDDPSASDPSLECATLPVPRDYAATDGDSIDLALIRVPAANSATRKGAILTNPGGPGGSGFDFAANAAGAIAQQMALSDFDIIGFDPRGVDRSGGIRCQTDADADKFSYLDDTPDTPAEQALLDASETAFANACKAKFGDTLAVYSTANTARDMDSIRVALGDEKISYIGISYGTYLGAVYATMFPDRVRAMVLDSAYAPGGDTVEEQYKTQLVGFENAFNDWIAWCTGNAECPFSADGKEPGAKWDALRTQLDGNPIVMTDGRFANQSVLNTATKSALYSKGEWPVLAAALDKASRGDGSGLFRLADNYSGRHPDGTYDTIFQSNPIISCASGIEDALPPDPEALAATLRNAAPRFGKDIVAADFSRGSRCSDLMAAQPLDKISYSGDAPIVVIGGENDPATPIRWAQEMAQSMGPSARLVRYTGEGHGQILVSKCVTDVEAAVLASLTPPGKGTVCDPDPEIAKPDWWDTLPVPKGVDDILNSPEIAGQLGLTPTQAFSEIRTTSLSINEAKKAYSSAIEGAGFSSVGEQEPIPGVPQLVFSNGSPQFFSILFIGPDALKDPQLKGLAALVPAGKSLVILLALPG